MRRELEHHVDASTDHLIAQGLPADLARREAVKRLGSLEGAERRLIALAHHREVRMRLREAIPSFVQDLRYAGRVLRRQPLVTTVIVATLALGIGVNGAMFGILDRLLLSGPAHVREADRVLRLYLTTTDGPGAPRTESVSNYATLAGLETYATSFSAVAAYGTTRDIAVGEGPDGVRAKVQHVTWTLFPLLGVQPAAGRFFGALEDSAPAGEAVAVLSDGFWAQQFDRDPAAIGRRLVLASRSYLIVGVAPHGFTGPELGRVDVWLPVSAGSAPRLDWPTTWNAYWLFVIGRLKPGVSAEEAGAEATACIGKCMAARRPAAGTRSRR